MVRIPFSTTLDEDKLGQFKNKCKEDTIQMNEALELFFDLYLNGDISFSRTVTINNTNR